MKKAERTEEECLLFEEEVNKTLLNNKKEKFRKEKIKKEKIEKYYVDYKNVLIPELIELVKKCENRRIKAGRILKGMEKVKRTNDECLLFKEEANKLLTKKI